nr:MAG TPA: hypothetical protein [Caudoviricetes sp.]
MTGIGRTKIKPFGRPERGAGGRGSQNTRGQRPKFKRSVRNLKRLPPARG